MFLLCVFDALLNQKLRDVESTALSKEGYTASAEYTCKKRITAFQKNVSDAMSNKNAQKYDLMKLSLFISHLSKLYYANSFITFFVI